MNSMIVVEKTSIFCVFCARVPLIKHKTTREIMEEKGQWEEFRLRYPYNPMGKFDSNLFGAEQMTNDADVRGLHELLRFHNRTMDIVCHWFVFWCVQWLVFLSPCSLLTMESFPLARHLSPSQWSLTLALPTSGFPPPFAAALRVVCTNILFKYSVTDVNTGSNMRSSLRTLHISEFNVD